MENTIHSKSFTFAIRIIKLHQHFCETRHEFVLTNQLLRCGTSIGANAREAEYAQSKKDFVSKMSIALKEANETKYWLKLLHGAEYLTESQANSILSDCIELIKMLTASVKTAKQEL